MDRAHAPETAPVRLPAPVPTVLGATATGKSDLAVELARRLGGEVVSFDASTVYRGFDVGTAKPSAAIRSEIPHHLIDVLKADEPFSAALFAELAEKALADITARGRTPILVGGTGLYLRSLLRGLVESPPPDPDLRARLEQRARRRPGSLLRLLERLDPATARRLSRKDVFRQVRALEHRLATGRPLSSERVQWRAAERFPAAKVGLHLPRAVREERIRLRVDRMLAGGLVEEVRALLANGLSPEAPAFRALGYREVVSHVRGELSLDEVRERMAVATRQYAKRQDTWFRREPGVTWLPAATDSAELPALVARAMMVLRPFKR